MLKKLFIIGITMGFIGLLLLLPIIHATIVVANFILHCCILGLQLVAIRLPWIRPATRRLPMIEPFVSIHVPAHNEPPEVLMETLASLSRLKWSNYEVLIIDNNTTDEALWRPVEEFCVKLGPKFRFLHVENMAGFKAGAMNWARNYMDTRAEFIFVVDADYQVTRDCLKRALRHVTDDRIGLVQFPQSYRNVTCVNQGLALDFQHFFAGYMNMANRLGCVPSTGTLTLINVKALIDVGGFDTRIITEDAELGFRMTLKGWNSIYVNEIVGEGLMPYDLEGLKKQRWRWAFGNAQILKANWRRILLGSELSWPQKFGFVAHMTAWFNFNLIPSMSLILLAAVAVVGEVSPIQHYTVIVSGLTLVTYLFLRFGVIFYGLRRDGCSLREIGQAFFTHLGLGWIFSLSWLKCLWDHRSPFVRTNKFISEVVPGQVRFIVAELTTGILMLLACGAMVLTDFVVGPIAALAMFVARFAILWVWRQTVATCQWTERQFAVRPALPSEAAVLASDSGCDPLSAR